VVSAIIGEGGSGGALALGLGDRVMMQEHAWFSVLSPEGCASILFRERTPAAVARSAALLRLTASDLHAFSVVDEVVREPGGGAHRRPEPPRPALRPRPRQPPLGCAPPPPPSPRSPPLRPLPPARKPSLARLKGAGWCVDPIDPARGESAPERWGGGRYGAIGVVSPTFRERSPHAPRAHTGNAPRPSRAFAKPTAPRHPRGERCMPRKSSIPALRRQIDRIDDQLLRLLNRRARLALEIARQKARTNSGVYAPGREKGVLARLARANPGPLPERLVRAIFREIISASRSLEPHLRVAYLRPQAAS